MRRVEQKRFYDGDCGIACAAIVSGTTYDDAKSVAQESGTERADGTWYTRDKELASLLEAMMLNFRKKHFVRMRIVETPAIVKVFPRAGGKYWHWIVVATIGGRLTILDPKPGKPARIRDFRGYKGYGEYFHIA